MNKSINRIKIFFKRKRTLKNPKDFLIFTISLFFVFGVVYAYPALNTISGGFKIASNSVYTTIDAHGTCKKVKKAGTDDFFVPTGTQGEWTAFINSSYTGKDLADCGGACVPTTWSPLASSVCSGNSFIQSSNCGTTRTATGTKDCSGGGGCTETSWTPDSSTVCNGETFTQSSNCGTTRTATGTKDCSTPAYVCTNPNGYEGDVNVVGGQECCLLWYDCGTGVPQSCGCAEPGIRVETSTCQSSGVWLLTDTSECIGSF